MKLPPVSEGGQGVAEINENIDLVALGTPPARLPRSREGDYRASGCPAAGNLGKASVQISWRPIRSSLFTQISARIQGMIKQAILSEILRLSEPHAEYGPDAPAPGPQGWPSRQDVRFVKSDRPALVLPSSLPPPYSQLQIDHRG